MSASLAPVTLNSTRRTSPILNVRLNSTVRWEIFYGQFSRNTGSGWTYANGSDITLSGYSPEIIAHFQLIEAFLPADWASVSLLHSSVSPISGGGSAGNQTDIFYYTAADVEVVPIPAALPLLVSALGLLVVKIRRGK